MKVAELARAGGVTAETVRHYTELGLLRPQRDPTPARRSSVIARCGGTER